MMDVIEGNFSRPTDEYIACSCGCSMFHVYVDGGIRCVMCQSWHYPEIDWASGEIEVEVDET